MRCPLVREVSQKNVIINKLTLGHPYTRVNDAHILVVPIITPQCDSNLSSCSDFRGVGV